MGLLLVLLLGLPLQIADGAELLSRDQKYTYFVTKNVMGAYLMFYKVQCRISTFSSISRVVTRPAIDRSVVGY